ncbi:MAG: EamA family transporter RarD [Sporomusaceae bacterium]|nr:EamA family transporter RarD [Sporomusaceae bacterium]
MRLQDNSGLAAAVGAYVLWGILPVYWKLLGGVAAPEILAHRILWSFVFMTCLILLIRRQREFWEEVKSIVSSPKKTFVVICGALLISLNWLVYIWAVNEGRMIETSLGYYINPLVNVLLGVGVLKERLNGWQSFAILLAGAAVGYLTWHFGSVPFVALALASSFALYGLCKKLVRVSPITGVTLETMLIAPVACTYLFYLEKTTGSSFSVSFTATSFFLIGTGIITAIPLLLFAQGANKLPLSILGLIQYVSPTLTLLLGIFLYQEVFTAVHFISFSCIWLALLLFSLAKTPFFTALGKSFAKVLVR